MVAMVAVLIALRQQIVSSLCNVMNYGRVSLVCTVFYMPAHLDRRG
jgi:hypothetical protein